MGGAVAEYVEILSGVSWDCDPRFLKHSLLDQILRLSSVGYAAGVQR